MTTLADEIREYLARAHAYAWSLADDAGVSPDEPAIVHAFLADEMWPVLQDVIRARVRSHTDVVVKGIFTHQTPKVKELGAGSGCEIADLMLVRMHVPGDTRKNITGKAILFQAKHKEGPQTEPLTGDGDTAQLRLYRDWNPFLGTLRLSVTPSDHAKSTSWDFRRNGIDAVRPVTAQYLSVLNGRIFTLQNPDDPQHSSVLKGADHARIREFAWPNDTCWANGEVTRHSSPELGVQCPDDFAKTLEEFISQNVGREFDTSLTGSSDHWSIFVRDMLEIANLKNYRFGKKRRTRANQVSLFSSCLPLIAEQQVRDFMAGGMQGDFEFINNALKREGDSRSHDGGGIPVRPDDDSPMSPPAHVPLLLVLTYGEDVVIG